MASSYQDRIKARRSTGVNKKKKVKPVSNDPRPVWKKGESREEYRKRLLPWRERQKAKRIQERKDKLKKEGKKDTKRGTRPDRKTSNDLKVKKEPYAADKVGKVDLDSQQYKEAKRINEQPVEYQTNVSNKKDNQEDNQKDNQEVKKKKSKYPEVTQEQLDKKIAEMNKEKKSGGSGKKESRWIRNPKTKTLVRRTSQKGKQLLKIQARKDALIKKRFGDKKKKKK